MGIKLNDDEVILYEGKVLCEGDKEKSKLMLTSQRIIVEKEQKRFLKKTIIFDEFSLKDVKFYNNKAQFEQDGEKVRVQTTGGNLDLIFSERGDAKKFVGKAINATTGTTKVERGSEKIKRAFDIIDDTLGLDVRATIKSISKQGIKGTLLNGTNQKEKDVDTDKRDMSNK